jgi:phage terminase large subunit-like protein
MVDLLKSRRFAKTSPASWLASQGKAKQSEWFDGLTEEEIAAIPHWWDFWARPEQRIPSGDWQIWLVKAGRGAGKTRIGAEWIRKHAEDPDQAGSRFALVARTAADIRSVVVEGESGILAVSDPQWRPTYEPSKRRLTWPNGTQAETFTADEPDQLRGPQHHKAWADELAAWKGLKAKAEDNPWDQLMFGLRLGDNPQCVATTTPRPKKLIRELMADPMCVVTHGSTYDNIGNLAKAFAQRILAKYEGTTAGRQEIMGELIDQLPGALWWHSMIDEHRVRTAPDLVRIAVGVDPSVTSKETSNECGIVVAGKGPGAVPHFYVLSDRSLIATPKNWAGEAISALDEYDADRIIAEVNNGGDLVEETIRNIDADTPYSAVRASRGKLTRAEPISALYEQGRVHHVGGFDELEDQMCNYLPGDDSPDRMDALVWVLTELSGDGQSGEVGIGTETSHEGWAC